MGSTTARRYRSPREAHKRLRLRPAAPLTYTPRAVEPHPKLPDARVSREDLLRKYRALRALRAAEGPAPRASLRALAAEFPGALREVDALPMDEIVARERCLAARASLEESPAWARWLAAYHGLMRVTLALKRLLSARDHDDAALRALGDRATDPGGEPLGEDYVRAVRAPPRGRLGVVVFARLGARFEVPPEAIWQALFPTRREDRFAPGAGGGRSPVG